VFNYPLAPEQASTFGPEHDFIFYLITILAVFFTVVVMACVMFFALKYRRGSSANRDNIVHHSQKLEIAWSMPPLILGLMIFGLATSLFIRVRVPPANAAEFFVVGKQWMWHIQHPSGIRENNTLTVPIGRPVKLTMISQDVIHAFYVPAFRTQFMVIPGRYTTMWFEPTKEGKYPIFCNMYCGTQHSEMGGYVYVVSQPEYAAFVARGGDKKKENVVTLADQGKALFAGNTGSMNCVSCHGEKDSPQGPSLAAIAGTTRKLEEGQSALADDDYLRESIIAPAKRLSLGYEGTMPTDYKTQLSEEQIRNLIEYIKSLGSGNPATTTGGTSK
jgi:cytochrome c oxidase subunit 2